uniref:nitrous oxide-stimulated promoter family protein n=1 Tax=Anaerococcus mediterraneensis TaxID=1870984 RepID=UPI0009313DE7|nr:nitrous oxide-stimulated promoter family protein [Anaerococcus mediterraneensis]
MAENDRGFGLVSQMIDIYYKKNTGHIEKEELKKYVKTRLDHCPHGDDKPFCGHCQIGCYKKDYKIQIKEVMKYAGPRMIFVNPKAAISHLVEGIKSRGDKDGKNR